MCRIFLIKHTIKYPGGSYDYKSRSIFPIKHSIWVILAIWVSSFTEPSPFRQEMETIKETDAEDLDLHEAKTLIDTKGMSELAVRTLEELTKPGLARKSTFPRNFSTMSFSNNKRRKPSQDSIVSSYSRLDFTGSSLQLHLEVRPPTSPKTTRVSGVFFSKPSPT